MPVLKVKKDGEWKELSGSTSTPQPNWSQNNTSALDYIKDRTHYTEVSQKTRRFRPMDDYGFIEDQQFAEELYVNMQNAEYFINQLKCEYAGSGSDNSYNVVQHHENGDVYWLIEIEGAPNEETGVFDLTGVIKITPDFTDNSELEPLLRFENAFIRIVRETVHKLDEKYIPDDFAKTTDLENYATTSQLSSLRTDVNKKMMQNNPMGLGSFSMNGSGLVGERAVEVNSGNQATGADSFAQGAGTLAWGVGAHSEGSATKARGTGSHAEGYFSKTKADAKGAHAEGEYATACTPFQHAEGRANVEDEDGTYAHIVGNGTDDENRSNAYALDWQGNGWFAGDVYVGSTSGIDKDEGSKKLATEDFVTEKIEDTTPADIGAAPESHASSANTYGLGNGTVYGHVKLSDKTTATDGVGAGVAATPYAVKQAYARAATLMNRSTNVNAADTNYTTLMARGTSLNNSETTPAVNGAIAWTYK